MKENIGSIDMIEQTTDQKKQIIHNYISTVTHILSRSHTDKIKLKDDKLEIGKYAEIKNLIHKLDLADKMLADLPPVSIYIDDIDKIRNNLLYVRLVLSHLHTDKIVLSKDTSVHEEYYKIEQLTYVLDLADNMLAGIHPIARIRNIEDLMLGRSPDVAQLTVKREKKKMLRMLKAEKEGYIYTSVFKDAIIDDLSLPDSHQVWLIIVKNREDSLKDVFFINKDIREGEEGYITQVADGVNHVYLEGIEPRNSDVYSLGGIKEGEFYMTIPGRVLYKETKDDYRYEGESYLTILIRIGT